MNLLKFICFLLLSLAGIGGDFELLKEVIGHMEHPDISNCNASKNGISQDPFRWEVSCVKCQKNIAKGVGTFCGKFWTGRGQ